MPFNIFFKKISIFNALLFVTLIINYSFTHASVQHIDDAVNNLSIGPSSSSYLTAGMPFKLGFEFQTGPGICLWAENDNNIQKHPLFSVRNIRKERTLWRVVIDSTEIEFVSEPFSHEERDLLQESVNTIFSAFNNLKESINQLEKTTFESWIRNFNASTDNTLYFANCIKSSIYDRIKDRPLIPKSLPWNPYFSPQATIQYPLEHTIPLYFSLFGFANEYMPNFSASLPLRDNFLKAQKEADDNKFQQIIGQYKTKINGLVFLHALSLVDMCPNDDEITESQLLKEIKTAYDESQQVDAKRKLTIMSRRPFSSMFKNIDFKEPYYQYFLNVLGPLTNKGIHDQPNTAFCQVPGLFRKVDYAEQFFDSDTGKPKSLLNFLSYFHEDFLNKNQKIITELLNQGIISITMLRNFNAKIGFPIADFLEKYYDLSLLTVDQPKGNITIDIDNPSIQLIRGNYDVLSPPLILNSDNAMGRYKNTSLEDIENYGEAIVEIRGIKNVQSYFLKKCGLELTTLGKFLVNPDMVEDHAMKLFDYLREINFSQPQCEREIFYLGIPSALKH